MGEYCYPGVYIDEVPSGVRPITGVSTSTAAFVGETQKGATNQARLVTGYAEFERFYGKPLVKCHLARSARLFFANVGERLYIVPVKADEGPNLNVSAYQEAFGLLDATDDISLLAVPGVGSPGMVEFGADYCRKRGDCFLIADLPPAADTVVEAQLAYSRVSTRVSSGPHLSLMTRHCGRS